MNGIERSVEAIEKLGKAGLIVSIVFGPCGNRGVLYSVTVLDPSTGKEFRKPFGASDFSTIAEILKNEVPALLAYRNQADRVMNDIERLLEETKSIE